MRSRFANILFMPVCSNCMRVLDVDVKYRASSAFSADPQTIVPQVCPHCGSLFEGIVTPNVTNGSIFHYDKSIYDPYTELRMGDY